jgi:hypothetical protein
MSALSANPGNPCARYAARAFEAECFAQLNSTARAPAYPSFVDV